MCLQLAQLGHGTALGERNRIAHLLLDLALDFLARSGWDHAADPGDRISRLPRFHLRPGTVTGIEVRIGSHVLTPTVGHALDEAWTVGWCAHPANGTRRRGADCQNITPIDPGRRHAERVHLGDEVADRPALLDRLMDRI